MLYQVSRFNCVTCDCLVERVYSDEYSSDVYCDSCEELVTRVEPRPAAWVAVAAYETDREYGGPEEGGWYYTSGSVIRGTAREFLAEDFPQVEVYKETLRMRFADCRNVMIRVSVEEQARQFPTNRPRYS